MRFLYFTDTHITQDIPPIRKDNFYQTLRNKFFEVKKIINNFNVDYILHGGDWFDRPDFDEDVFRDFEKILKSFNKPVYSIRGNHDFFLKNDNYTKDTILKLLNETGTINLISSEEQLILEKDGIKVQLTGRSFNKEIESASCNNYYMVKKRPDADYAINIIHGMLINKPFCEGIPYTLIENIENTEADITLSGHYHSGYGIIKVGSKYFINPGSLVRIISIESELRRKPKVVLIDVGKEIAINEIELESALPGEEVLYSEKLAHHHDPATSLYNFYKDI